MTPMPMTDPVLTLRNTFQAQRPLRGGSLIVTVFGDSLAPRGGAITLGSLIRLMAPFGLTDRLVRTSVSRLVDDDWLMYRRSGRLSEYALSATGRQRFAKATGRIYGGPVPVGDGRWTTVVLPPAALGDRQRLRELLRLEGFGELDPGVYVHPAVAPDDAVAALATHGMTNVLVFAADLVAGANAAALIARGWDLSALDTRYRRFGASFQPVADHLATHGPQDPAHAFVTRTLLIHDYRRIHLRDPRLPRALLPPEWAGHAAYALCRRLYEAVFASAEQHLDAVATRLDGPLPPAQASSPPRFPAP